MIRHPSSLKKCKETLLGSLEGYFRVGTNTAKKNSIKTIQCFRIQTIEIHDVRNPTRLSTDTVYLILTTSISMHGKSSLKYKSAPK